MSADREQRARDAVIEAANRWYDSVVVHPSSELSMNLRRAVEKLRKEEGRG